MVEWRPVVDYEGLYEVSSTGLVRSRPRQGTTGGILKPRATTTGYLMLTVSKDGRETTVRIHQIVAAAFHGPRPMDREVKHVDGNKHNNAATNLKYRLRGA